MHTIPDSLWQCYFCSFYAFDEGEDSIGKVDMAAIEPYGLAYVFRILGMHIVLSFGDVDICVVTIQASVRHHNSLVIN